MQEQIGIPHNQEGRPNQATEKVLESQRLEKSSLIDQYHLFPISIQIKTLEVLNMETLTLINSARKKISGQDVTVDIPLENKS